jgi:F-type H+-transporting ATPase subunit alpha
LAQYRELAAFAQFASDLDEATRKQLDRGARVTELLKQAQYSPLSISMMGATLFAVNKGFMDDIEVKKILSFEHGLHAYLKDKHAALLSKLEDSQSHGQRC